MHKGSSEQNLIIISKVHYIKQYSLSQLGYLVHRLKVS